MKNLVEGFIHQRRLASMCQQHWGYFVFNTFYMITINENFKINSDGFGCTLIHTEQKERLNKEGAKENYTTEESYHFLNVEQCLNRYLDLVLMPCENVLQVLEAIKQGRLEISKLNLKK